MKKLLVVFALLSMITALTGCKSSKIELFKPNSITLVPNPYVMKEDLLARRNDIPLRQINFFWAFEDSAPDLPARSDCIMEMHNVTTMIDSVAAVHLVPRIHAESGRPERRLVRVTIGEPMLTKDPIYEVESLDWVVTQVWPPN